MKALDTNVLARFFVSDPDDAQAVRQRPAAAAAMAARAWVPITVLLEFEWVMRGFYALPRAAVVKVLRALLGIEHVAVEDRAMVVVAVDGLEAGLDFADALHLARSGQAAGFATFDKQLAKRAAVLAMKPPVELLR